MSARRLIVNADDFGLSPETNRGIIRAHERGIVTSTSLMVRPAAAAAAAGYARAHPRLGVGLHIDLGEWAFRSGEWVALYSVAPTDDAGAVQGEVERQLEAFRALLGRDPDHLDSHQHVHRKEPVRAVVTELGARLGVPVRHFPPAVHYCGAFYGQDAEGTSYSEFVGAEMLVGILERLDPGTTELCCHPGFDSELETMYVRERAAEVEALCDPRVRAAVERLGIELVTFGELSEGGGRA
jgi:predicted glycoside hydrolase/deacetylase ChbG (UPF0249 family)